MSVLLKYFKSLFLNEKKTIIKQTSPEDELTQRLKPYERFLYKLEDIIAWKDPSFSVFVIVLVHFVFWFISHFEWRFFGFFFTSVSAVLFHDAWVNYIWPEIRVKKHEPKAEQVTVSEHKRECLLSLPELSHYATKLQSLVVKRYRSLKRLRTSQPAIFCLVSSTVCLLLTGIGNVLSGFALIYLLTLTILTIPGVYLHLVSPEQKEVISNILQYAYHIILPPESSRNVDEFMPDTSQENLDILSKAGNNSNDLSTPSSESSMVDLIPCHDESSRDTMDSFSLPASKEKELGNGSETDSEGDTLSFKNSHFNGSSSGEEEVSLVRDLSFPSIEPTQPKGFASSLSGVFYKTFPAISGRLQFKATGEEVIPAPAEEEDTDSEFEIIDEDS